MKIYKVYSKDNEYVEILRYFKNIEKAENFIKKWLEKFDYRLYFTCDDIDYKYTITKITQAITRWELQNNYADVIYIEEIEVEE